MYSIHEDWSTMLHEFLRISALLRLLHCGVSQAAPPQVGWLAVLQMQPSAEPWQASEAALHYRRHP